MAQQSSPVLDARASQPLPSSTSHPPLYTYYHAGPLFTLAELHTNNLLSRAIKTRSQGRFIPIIPQDLEQRDHSPHSIRDQDIRALVAADLALFTYDGPELDSGTVVEFMFAKMADIPAVILRTDFRGAGDQASGNSALGGGEKKKGDPWNLMSSSYPRVETVIVNSMMAYKTGLAEAIKSGRVPREDLGLAAGDLVIEQTAEAVVEAFERVVSIPPVLPQELRESVYEWLAIMPGFRDGMVEGNEEAMVRLSREKAERGLL